MDLIEHLDQWDRSLFVFLNGLHQPWLDEPMYVISSRLFWVPFYLLLAFFIYRKAGLAGLLGVLAAIGVLILLSDQTASGLLKPLVGRPRPCQPASGLQGVHLVHGHCGGAYGFVSSHAANFFALATFLAFFFRKRPFAWLFFGSAILTAYSRIYLGVHYPGDVLGGALVGLFWGWAVFALYVRLKDKIKKKTSG